MTRFRILPYRQGSRGAKGLAEALEGKLLRLSGSSYAWQDNDVLINWGNTYAKVPGLIDPEFFAAVCLNHPAAVMGATNKLNFFRLMKELEPTLIPEFWENKNDIPGDKYPIVCRTILAGHSGAGIVLADQPDDLADAQLYTRYVKKEQEYRVHVGLSNNPDASSQGGDGGNPPVSIISIQRKARRLDTPSDQVDWRVRNHNNGFVFVRGGVNPPESVLDAACRALVATSLDFGAVDVIWNAKEEKAYVLEINTAPGLEGQTIQDYANHFKGLVS